MAFLINFCKPHINKWMHVAAWTLISQFISSNIINLGCTHYGSNMFSKQTSRPWRRANMSALSRLGKSLICWMTLSCRGLERVGWALAPISVIAFRVASEHAMFVKTLSYSAGVGSQSSVPLYEILMPSPCKGHRFRNYCRTAWIFNWLQYS